VKVHDLAIVRFLQFVVCVSFVFAGCSSPRSPLGPAGRLDLLVQMGGEGYDSGYDIAVRPDGGFVVVGHFNRQATFGRGADAVVLTAAGFPDNLLIPDLFCASYDPDGNLEWVRSGSSSGVDLSQAVALGSGGEIYLVGSISDQAAFDSADGQTQTVETHGPEDGFIARYNSSGVLEWVFSYGGDAKSTLRDVTVLGNGNVATVGYIAGTAQLNDPLGSQSSMGSHGGLDILVVILQPDGTILQVYQEGGELNDYGMSVASSGSDGLIVGGGFVGNISIAGGQAEPWQLEDRGALGMFVCKYSGSAEVEWAVSGGGVGGEAHASANGLAVTPDEGIYLAGFYRDDSVFFPVTEKEITMPKRGLPSIYDGFLAKLDSNGTPQWALSLGGWSTDMATTVGIDSHHEPIVAGFYTQDIEFGDTGKTLSSRDKDFDAFVAGFDSSGQVKWARNFVGDGQDAVTALAVADDDSLMMTGDLAGTLKFSAKGEDILNCESRGEKDGYAVRLRMGAQ